MFISLQSHIIDSFFFKFGEFCDCTRSICRRFACDALRVMTSRDKWRPADVPLQAVGVASIYMSVA